MIRFIIISSDECPRVHRSDEPGEHVLMGDCWQPLVGRIIMNFYMRHSKEGDVKDLLRSRNCFYAFKYFRNVSWGSLEILRVLLWAKND